MRFARCALPLLIATLAAPAAAVELDLSLDGVVQAENNVERTDNDREGDVSFRFQPLGSIATDEGRWTGRLSYAPNFQKFVRETSQDNISHYLQGNGQYLITNKTSIGLSNRFSVVHALNQEDPGSPSGTPDADIRREQVIRNDASLELSHILAPRWSTTSTVGHSLFEGHDEDTVDSHAINFNQLFAFAYDGSNKFGLGGNASLQYYDEVPTQPGSDTQVYSLFGSWQRTFGESTVLFVQGGPALIHTSQDSALAVLQVDDDGDPNTPADDDDGVPGTDTPVSQKVSGPSDTSFTFFGTASLTQRWTDHVNSSLSYTRRESPATGLGASSILDQVSATTSWAPAQRWDLSVRGDWTQRKSASKLNQQALVIQNGVVTGTVPIESNESLDTSRWGVAGRAAYRLTRRTTAALNLRYSHQNTNRSTSGTEDYGVFVAMFGIRYDFDGWRF